jgi:hypothetical protein
MSDGSFPDALILAALRRAELHAPHDEPGVPYSFVVAHLGLPMGSATGCKLRPRFRELEAAGVIAPAKRHGSVIYTATRKGRRLLGAAGAVALPESPQHRRWREARARAGERIGEFRENVYLLFDEAAALLADDATDSEAWFVLGEQLSGACKRMASATYCLREWAEPGDDAPDVDDSRRRGRRNTRSWDCPHA